MSLGMFGRPEPAGTVSPQGQPNAATAPRWKAASTTLVLVAPACTAVTLRPALDGVSTSRRSSPGSRMQCPNQASVCADNGASGRPLINSTLPAACSALSTSAWAASPAMKAGTSIIICGPGSAAMTSRSSASPARFSDTCGAGLAAPALAGGRGHISSSARTSAAPSAASLERCGKMVSRNAVTARWAPIIGL